jgi:hypothetical protein
MCVLYIDSIKPTNPFCFDFPPQNFATFVETLNPMGELPLGVAATRRNKTQQGTTRHNRHARVEMRPKKIFKCVSVGRVWLAMESRHAMHNAGGVEGER